MDRREGKVITGKLLTPHFAHSEKKTKSLEYRKCPIKDFVVCPISFRNRGAEEGLDPKPSCDQQGAPQDLLDV